jgi:hypothetical protein
MGASWDMLEFVVSNFGYWFWNFRDFYTEDIGPQVRDEQAKTSPPHIRL